MNMPRHVAIILDGNGRWAKAKGMPRNYGHAQGSKNVERICEEAWRMGIKYLTVYAFSTENWNRPKDEVDALMKLLRNYMKTCLKTAAKNDMKIRVIGDITRLDEDIRSRIEELEESTKDNGGLNFQIAINYGSRDEITRAVRRIAADCRDGHPRYPGPGPSDPDQRGTAAVQLSSVAAGLYGILFYRCALAGFYQGRTSEGSGTVQRQRPEVRRGKGGRVRCLRQGF